MKIKLILYLNLTEANWSDYVYAFSPFFFLFLSQRCKVCPLTFLTKSEMQIHSKSHTEAKPHKCPHCSKTFANASYLSQHLRIHLGIKPYHCSYCENSFRQLSHLQQHTRSVQLCAQRRETQVSVEKRNSWRATANSMTVCSVNTDYSCLQHFESFIIIIFFLAKNLSVDVSLQPHGCHLGNFNMALALTRICRETLELVCV